MAASIAFQGGVTQAGSSASYSLAFTATSAAGQERLVALVAVTSNFSAATFTNVLIDGQTATQLGSYARIGDGNGTNGPFTSFWRAAGTANTSINVTFDSPSSLTFDARGMLWNLSNAGALLSSTVVTLGLPVGSDVVHFDVNTVANGAVAAALFAYGSSTAATTWVGLTERWDIGNQTPLYGGDWYSAADLNVTSGSTPLTITAQMPSDFFDVNDVMTGVAVSFSPSGGGATTILLPQIWL